MAVSLPPSSHKRVASRPPPAVEVDEEVEIIEGEDGILSKEVCEQWPALEKFKVKGIEYVRYDAVARKNSGGARPTSNEWIWEDGHYQRVIEVEKGIAITMIQCHECKPSDVMDNSSSTAARHLS